MEFLTPSARYPANPRSEAIFPGCSDRRMGKKTLSLSPTLSLHPASPNQPTEANICLITAIFARVHSTAAFSPFQIVRRAATAVGERRSEQRLGSALAIVVGSRVMKVWPCDKLCARTRVLTPRAVSQPDLIIGFCHFRARQSGRAVSGRIISLARSSLRGVCVV